MFGHLYPAVVEIIYYAVISLDTEQGFVKEKNLKKGVVGGGGGGGGEAMFI